MTLPFIIILIRQKHSLSTQTTPSNSIDFAGIFLSCFAELPSNILVYFTIDRPGFGRKNSMTYGYIACSLVCIYIYIIPDNIDFFYFALVGLVKFIINFNFCTIYPFTAEVYETALRATGLGLNSAVSRFGGILMPWISFMFFAFGENGPFLAFGIVSAISAVSSFLIKKDTTEAALDYYHKKKS